MTRTLRGLIVSTPFRTTLPLAALLLATLSSVACDDAPNAASASAKSSAAPPPTHSAAAPTATASASAEAGPLPNAPLKDSLKDVKSIMAQGKGSGPMGVMITDKKDVDALVASLGTDQVLNKAYDAKCVSTTNLDFQSPDKKSLGALGFCDADGKYETGSFQVTRDSGKAEIKVKDPAALKALLKKIGAIKDK